jgi:hypothetical protein
VSDLVIKQLTSILTGLGEVKKTMPFCCIICVAFGIEIKMVANKI